MSNLPSNLIIDNGDGDEPMSNQSANQAFETVLNARLSRRAVLKGGLGSAITALFGGAGALGLSSWPKLAGATSPKLMGFEAVTVSVADTVVVPKGYKVQPLGALGHPNSGK